jgi:thermitase
MRPHLIVKVRGSNQGLTAPPWVTFIRDKSHTRTSLTPQFDALARSHGLRFWVTHEYEPVGERWSDDEVAAGLDRFYRVILLSIGVPRGLVDAAHLISDFESVRELDVRTSELPDTSAHGETVALRDNSRELIGLKLAHLFGKGSPDIKVAVLDTGVSGDHPELQGQVRASADFVHLDGLDTREFIGDMMDFDQVAEDEVGHGSHVSGIIAGRGLRMAPGVATGCTVLAVRVLATMRDGGEVVGAGIPDNINTGIKWAVDRGADVINLSLGIKQSGGGLPHEDVIRYALIKGVTIVAASGNDGSGEKYYPGSLPGGIAVGATDRAGNLADFTSFGAPPWILAPGTAVLSCSAGRGYQLATGTSQASPFVAGAVALLKSIAARAGARLRDEQLKELLRHTSDRPDTRLRSPKTGFGRLNLADACRLLNHELRARSARSLTRTKQTSVTVQRNANHDAARTVSERKNPPRAG